MLLVGDKIKQVKEIPGFNYVGRDFNVIGVEGNSISFSNPCMGRGVMTLVEFETYFEKVVEPKWSEWRYNTRLDMLYRVKGHLIEASADDSSSSVFCKPCEQDTFDLQLGLEICKLKLEIKEATSKLKELKEKLAEY